MAYIRGEPRRELRPVLVRLTMELFQEVDQLARDLDVGWSTVIRLLVKEALAARGVVWEND